MRPILRGAALAVLVACADTSNLPTDQVTGPSLSQNAKSEIARPLKGSCDRDVTVLSIGPDGSLELSINYTCHLSHLGLSHNSLIETITPKSPLRFKRLFAFSGLHDDKSAKIALTISVPHRSVAQVYPAIKGTPGESRRRKATGLHDGYRSGRPRMRR